MHSKLGSNAPQHKRRRLTPYLITAGVGFAMATTATASPEQKETAKAGKSEIPAPTIDSNGDGKPDAWDRNGDRKPDAWDIDGDGSPDLVDDDGDGKPD
jgi:hypothetical protein